MAAFKSALRFAVRRRAASLVSPASQTPREVKRLSDIDDHDRLRVHVPLIHFYRRRKQESMRGGGDPAQVIRAALAKALVDYYPLAGRLRELHGRKLAVDCTGEGVLFTEADAEVRLDQFGDGAHAPLLPPFPCLPELIFDVPGSSAILDSPLLLFQVTRLACGGFILGVRLNHTMVDGQGVTQFLGAVAELARGAPAPTVRPVWRREVLDARDPPRPRFPHHELDEMPAARSIVMGPLDRMAHRYIFFGPEQVAAIRAQLPPRLQRSATRFDVVVGWLWRCRTAALAPDPDEEMRMMFAVDARGRAARADGGVDGVPFGYYGNAFTTPVAVSTAGELCAEPVSHAVELVRKAKKQVDMEYLRSTVDLMVLRGRRFVMPSEAAFAVSDVTKARFADLDFGWGRAVYGGPAEGVGSPMLPWFVSFLLPFKNGKGEEGVAVPMSLPGAAMDRVVEEMGKLLQVPADNVAVKQNPFLSASNSKCCNLKI